MAQFSFITEKNIYSRYEDSKKYTEDLTRPYPEFQRIARNRPYEGIDPAYPKTTDGTTASIIQKTPKRVVQQLPTGLVETDDDKDWLPLVAQFIYTNKIIKYANEDYGLLEKSQLIIEGGLTFGAACSLAPFLNHDGYFCPDMVLPYWGDVFLQRGKKSGPSCNYVFIRAWWQKEDLESLIDSENKLSAKASKRGEKYTATWDTAALKKILDAATSKDNQGRTPTEEERGTNVEAIELVTAFQKGVKGKFYTFNPTTKTIVRTKTNKDPRGKIPIDWMYGDIDGSNPLGRGIVELIGGLQNLIDSDMQMYQYNRALMLAPPVVKHGNISNFKFAPNNVSEATAPTDKIEVITIDTSAVANYPALYGLQKSQLLNLVTSPDQSIGADIGNPGFGKTPEALSQQKAAISVDDNAVRKRFETWFGNWSETALNIYFAERTGKEILQLDEDTAMKLRKLAEEDKFDESLLSENNELLIDYDTATPALKFRINASTSKMSDDTKQLAALSGLLETLEKNPVLQSVVPPEKIVGVWNSIVSNSGVEDPEDLTIDIKEFEKQQEVAQEQAQTQQQGQPQEVKSPSESLSFKDVAAIAPKAAAQMLIQAGLPGDELLNARLAAVPQVPQPQSPAVDPDEQYAQQLTQLGLSDSAVNQVMTMMRQGANEQQVLQVLMAQGASNG